MLICAVSRRNLCEGSTSIKLSHHYLPRAQHGSCKMHNRACTAAWAMVSRLTFYFVLVPIIVGLPPAILIFTIVPHCELEGAILQCASTMAMLSTTRPVTLVLPTIWPNEDTETIFPVKQVLSGILPSVGPQVFAHAVNHRILPRALVPPAIAAQIRALPVDGVGLPRPAVLRRVRPEVDAVAFFLAVVEDALESGTLGPCLHAIPFLEIVRPLTSVACLVLVVVASSSMRNICLPLADVRVAVAVGKATFPVRTVFLPLALVGRTIRPDLYAKAMPCVASPLASVSCT
mmetsp:Transcript_18084/g.51266  ORF Transcript_18084/g.51266 Transcript_18084/m.51266 type:complete len:289 (-) Transcript_18084:302-1168(-)